LPGPAPCPGSLRLDARRADDLAQALAIAADASLEVGGAAADGLAAGGLDDLDEGWIAQC
jgi:hypothetical protein